MTKSNIASYVDAIVKLARKAHKAENTAKSTFAAMITFIKDNGLAEYFTNPANRLDDTGKAFNDALKTRLAKVYGWPKDKVSDYYRHWRMRVRKELTGDTQASRSKRQRARSVQFPRTDVERWADVLAMAIEEPIAKEVRGALEAMMNTIMAKLDK